MEYQSSSEAERAINVLDGVSMRGRKVSVSLANAQKQGKLVLATA